ncbi:MAG: Holliday junction branch migration protein RuvA [Synergistaceae bacterium]|jgi:Holliday junction DNA helicase RuvA|nr:Holliday junction branch migration protein RuvA [Synergistaceae bacterium]
MIRRLSGIVAAVEADLICLDVSGFGLEVYATGTLIASARVGEPLTCAAYLHSSDAGMALFGFSDELERSLFLEITQVKTMGGKLSISLLRHLDANTVISAIKAGDSVRLAVPGLGPKRAERICFELRAKVEKKFTAIAGVEAQASGGSLDAGVITGLVGLGFSQSEALRAVSSCRVEFADRTWTEEDLMMSALGRLQRR